ncbi:MAG: SusC/RagA family TonB-linked outer membrane protein, partial [Gemmatimonadales bacterium]
MHPWLRTKTFAGGGAALVLALLLHLPAAAQQTGTVDGVVSAAETGQPLAGAQVTVEGTTLGTLTGADGTFSLSNVPAGTQNLEVRFIGFATTRQEVEVVAGEVVEVTFRIEQQAIGLEGIVVTAGGEEVRRRELGNVVGNIIPDESDLSSVTNFSDLLQGRSAGVTVSGSGGTVGTGARIRIRGSASVSLSNDPLIIIDGVRADNSSQSSSIGVGGQSFSRFEDLNPQDIENIEILKGPAATAMYGTAAAAGAIQITTRRGRVGDARWNLYTEQGIAQDPHEYPANFTGISTAGQPGCRIDLQAAGVCELESLQSFNPIEESGILRTGYRQRYGLNVSGGSEQFTYFMSGELQEDEGALPNNDLSRVSFRGNFNQRFSETLDVSLRTGYTTGTTRLPQNDNNILGMISGALLGSAQDGPTQGWIVGGPDALGQYETAQQVDRLVGGVEANWQAADWLSFRGSVGMDNVERHDNSFVPPRTIFFGTLPTGERISNRIEVETYTARLSGRTSYRLSPSIQANTAVGGEFNRELFQGTYASATGLLDGTRSLGAGTDDFSVSEAFSDVRTIAGWIEQRIAWQDRVYLNAALRADDDNSFGDQFDLIWYPSLSLSWVMNEEAWFPESPTFNSLRVRGAVGRAGLRPGFRDAVFFLTPQTVNVDGTNQPGFSIGGAGNPDLRPEIVTEFELGFDAGFFEDRIGLEATYFHKQSQDALVSRRLAPSLGATTTRFENLAEVVNQGVEFGIDAVVTDRPGFRLTAGAAGSFTDNELTDLGDVEPIIFGLGGDSQRHQEGFPLGGYWGRTIQEVNIPDEGPVTPDDVVLSDEAQFIGSALPTREFSFNMNVDLLDRVSVRALVDHQGGHYLFNSTREFRCLSFQNCREIHDPDADPMKQAQALAGLYQGAPSVFVEPADFTRLREVAVTFTAPSDLAARVGADGLRLTLAGRNLATWTDYT